MLKGKGKGKNGAILPLEPIDKTHEGQNVIITFIEENEDWNKLLKPSKKTK